MSSDSDREIYSLGHSNRDRQTFLEILKSFQISHLVDVRRNPGSRRFPHFNKGNLSSYLPDYNVRYHHLESLGGYVGEVEGSDQIEGWQAEGFRNYAAYAKTDSFRKARNRLTDWAQEKPTAFMCAERYYRKCHRQIIADYLVAEGWTVKHISSPSSCQDHKPRPFAHLVNNRVVYRETSGDNEEAS